MEITTEQTKIEEFYILNIVNYLTDPYGNKEEYKHRAEAANHILTNIFNVSRERDKELINQARIKADLVPIK